MKCPSHKHEIIIWLNCDQFARLQEAAQFVGRDIESYIIAMLADNC